MNRLNFIRFEWNCYNGFVFNVLDIEAHKPIDFEGSLFGIYISKDFFYIEILFMTIMIFDRFPV